MAQEQSQTTIRRELIEKEEQIKRRLDALEDEIVSTPAAIKSVIFNHPLMGIGGAIAVGALIGLIVGVRRKKNARSAPAPDDIMDGYIASVVEEVRRGVEKGRDPESIVRKTLRRRAPIVVYAPGSEAADSEDSKGMLRQLGDLTLKTALGFAVKTTMDLLMASIDVQKLQNTLLRAEANAKSSAKGHQAHAGDGYPDPSAVSNEPADL